MTMDTSFCKTWIRPCFFVSRDFGLLLGLLDSSAGTVSVREWDLRCLGAETGLPVLVLAGLVADRPVEATSNESSTPKLGGTSCTGCPERPRECSRVGIDLELEALSLLYFNADLDRRTYSDENASTGVTFLKSPIIFKPTPAPIARSPRELHIGCFGVSYIA